MAKVGRKYSEKEVKKMMKDVDQDGDGCINYYGRFIRTFLELNYYVTLNEYLQTCNTYFGLFKTMLG